MKNKKAIIWDWNGTLLDDIDICIECMNDLLCARFKPELEKISYREIFTFPVKEYYQNAGFDFNTEPFEKPAMEFISLYYRNLPKANLFPSVRTVLQYFKEKSISQSVLSAMEHKKLMISLKEKGIIYFFENITGIEDHYAHSKVEIGKELLQKIPFKKDEIVLIGDTLHDFEVAETLGLDCILIANGHQSYNRLKKSNVQVVKDINDIIRLF